MDTRVLSIVAVVIAAISGGYYYYSGKAKKLDIGSGCRWYFERWLCNFNE
jgi:hypothetical protein